MAVKQMMNTGTLSVLLVLAYFTIAEVAADECHFFREDVCCSVGDCGRGTYFDSFSTSCLPCPPGTVLDFDKHGCRECRECKKPNEGMTVVEECSAVKDAELACDPEHYETSGDRDFFDRHCQPCTKCPADEYIRRCGKDTDAVCGHIFTPVVDVPVTTPYGDAPVTTDKTNVIKKVQEGSHAVRISPWMWKAVLFVAVLAYKFS